MHNYAYSKTYEFMIENLSMTRDCQSHTMCRNYLQMEGCWYILVRNYLHNGVVGNIQGL